MYLNGSCVQYSGVTEFTSALIRCFNGVLSTEVGPEQALVMEQESDTLLCKGAVECSPTQREVGFQSCSSLFQRQTERGGSSSPSEGMGDRAPLLAEAFKAED